jgi:hypothetical protein
MDMKQEFLSRQHEFLSTRAVRGLLNGGWFSSVEEITPMAIHEHVSPRAFVRQGNIGKKTCNEVRDWLKANGIEWGVTRCPHCGSVLK